MILIGRQNPAKGEKNGRQHYGNHHLHNGPTSICRSGSPPHLRRQCLPSHQPPRHPLLLPSPNFSDLGVTFNDATRALEGGLWQNVVRKVARGLGSVGRYTTDLTNVQTGLQAEMSGQFTGATLSHVNATVGRYHDRAIGSHGLGEWRRTFGSVAAAETRVEHEPSRYP